MKIVDFGLALIEEASFCKHHCSPMCKLYTAPEKITELNYDVVKCDVWSVGVIFYELIFKKTPWLANSEYSLVLEIKANPITFTKISEQDPEILDVITKMLEVNPEKRINLEEILNHSLFQRKLPDLLIL